MVKFINELFTQKKLTPLYIKHRYFDSFVFIHINKTGGSSIAKALNIPFDHATALEKIEEIGCEKWQKRLTFTVVRNPWDKVVSHYHYRQKTNQTNLLNKPISFQEWVQLAYEKQDPFYYDSPKMFMPQMDWITNKKGDVLVDEILHFENLSHDFNELMQKLGKIEALPHLNESKRGNYRNYYDETTAEIVRAWFEKDIRHFGFQF